MAATKKARKAKLNRNFTRASTNAMQLDAASVKTTAAMVMTAELPKLVANPPRRQAFGKFSKVNPPNET